MKLSQSGNIPILYTNAKEIGIHVKLTSHCKTRFSNIYEFFSRFLKLRVPLEAFWENIAPPNLEKLTREDWALMAALNVQLEDFRFLVKKYEKNDSSNSEVLPDILD